MKKELAELLKHDIRLGTSSWKYEGWKDLVYKEPYKSTKHFNDTCLEEYAASFPTVGVDHTYYAWPTAKAFEKYVSEVPKAFKFGLKVTEKVTVFKYPNLKRYGKDAGKINELFLDGTAFKKHFIEPLEPYRKNLGPIMFEFSHFYPGTIGSGHEFVDRLDGFFSQIKDDRFLYAVEIRNKNWLEKPYFEVLSKHGVAHVFNSWTKMPLLQEQWLKARDYKLPAIVARLLLNPGVQYEEAVEAYSPYNKLFEHHEAVRAAMVSILEHAMEKHLPAYVFVNNRFEGCAPLTIQALLEMLLKKKVSAD